MGVLLIAGVGNGLPGGNLGQSSSGASRELMLLGGNMEGKEIRFGQALTALYVVATTGLSCGAVNAMHDSLTPIGGLVPLVMIQLGRDPAGWHGFGPLRHSRDGNPHGLHRRPHGGPYP